MQALIVDFKVLEGSPRLLPLVESPNNGPQISIRVIGSSVGILFFEILPLTYDEYEERFPDVDLNDIFPTRPLNSAGDSDFNKTTLVFQGPGAIFTPPGARIDSIPELSEGFIYFLEVDRDSSDSRDYNRLQFLNRHILATIEDDDAIVTCGSNLFDNVVTVTCSGFDELIPDENVQCSVDFGIAEDCLFPFDIALSILAPGQHNLQVYGQQTISHDADDIVGGTQFSIESLTLYFVNNTPIIIGDRLYAEIGVNKPGSQMECHLTRLANSRKDCSNGIYEMDGIPPGDYSLRVVARDPRRPSSEKAILRNRLRFNDISACVVHSMNDGLRVVGNTMTVEFVSTGSPGPTGYRCRLDRAARAVQCSNPYSVENLPIGEHRIKVIPRGCGRNFRAYNQKFTVF